MITNYMMFERARWRKEQTKTKGKNKRLRKYARQRMVKKVDGYKLGILDKSRMSPGVFASSKTRNADEFVKGRKPIPIISMVNVTPLKRNAQQRKAAERKAAREPNKYKQGRITVMKQKKELQAKLNLLKGADGSIGGV